MIPVTCAPGQEPGVKTVYAVGNPDVPEDALALEVARSLGSSIPGYHFEELRHPEKLISAAGELWILDVVKGLPKVALIEDSDKILSRKITTLHDFDLGALLKIMIEAGTISSVKIIGLPMGASCAHCAAAVRTILAR